MLFLLVGLASSICHEFLGHRNLPQDFGSRVVLNDASALVLPKDDPEGHIEAFCQKVKLTFGKTFTDKQFYLINNFNRLCHIKVYELVHGKPMTVLVSSANVAMRYCGIKGYDTIIQAANAVVVFAPHPEYCISGYLASIFLLNYRLSVTTGHVYISRFWMRGICWIPRSVVLDIVLQPWMIRHQRS